MSLRTHCKLISVCELFCYYFGSCILLFSSSLSCCKIWSFLSLKFAVMISCFFCSISSWFFSSKTLYYSSVIFSLKSCSLSKNFSLSVSICSVWSWISFSSSLLSSCKLLRTLSMLALMFKLSSTHFRYCPLSENMLLLNGTPSEKKTFIWLSSSLCWVSFCLSMLSS